MCTNLVFKENIRKHKLVLFALLISSLLLGSAYALTYLWSAPVTVSISTTTPYIKVYYGANEVTSINFGNLVPGADVSIYLTIRNTHPNATFSGINWGSTLSSVTTEIMDSWVAQTFNWPLTIGPGSSAGTYYRITVASDCPIATYSWTLYLYGPG